MFGLSRGLLIISLFFGLQSFASQSQCASIFNPLLNPEFRLQNRTAHQTWEEYQQPNSRNLEEYNSILNTHLENEAHKGSLVMDLGGGKGVAGFELSEKTGAHVMVVNAQSPPHLQAPKPKQGQYEYVSGWAEEVLVKFDNHVDVITDLWGAFSYSPAKIDMLKAIFKALKPGGKAFVLYHPFKTTTKVMEKMGESPQYLDQWLQKKFPNLMTVAHSENFTYGAAYIITITKPADGSVQELDIPLKLVHFHYMEYGRNSLPESFYGPLDYH